jgi:hypothetical protein
MFFFRWPHGYPDGRAVPLKFTFKQFSDQFGNIGRRLLSEGSVFYKFEVG